MKNIALTLPGGNIVNNPPGFNPDLNSLGSLITGFLNIAFFMGAFMAFFWLVWAAFQYILAGGKKEELAKARSRITWALIGLMVILMAYFIATFAAQLLPTRSGPKALPVPEQGAPFR